jgi:hypothetical protein
VKINLLRLRNPIDTAEQICYTSKQIGGGSPVTIDSEAAMNEARRKVLTGAAKELSELIKEIGATGFEQWSDKLASIKGDLESVKDEEEEAFENLSEGLQQGEKGSRMEEVVGELDEAMGSLDEVVEHIDEAKEWVTELDDILGKIEAAKE